MYHPHLFDLLTEKLNELPQGTTAGLQGPMCLYRLFACLNNGALDAVWRRTTDMDDLTSKKPDLRNEPWRSWGMSAMIQINQSELFPALGLEGCIALKGLRRAHLGLTG